MIEFSHLKNIFLRVLCIFPQYTVEDKKLESAALSEIRQLCGKI